MSVFVLVINDNRVKKKRVGFANCHRLTQAAKPFINGHININAWTVYNN